MPTRWWICVTLVSSAFTHLEGGFAHQGRADRLQVGERNSADISKQSFGDLDGLIPLSRVGEVSTDDDHLDCLQRDEDVGTLIAEAVLSRVLAEGPDLLERLRERRVGCIEEVEEC